MGKSKSVSIDIETHNNLVYINSDIYVKRIEKLKKQYEKRLKQNIKESKKIHISCYGCIRAYDLIKEKEYLETLISDFKKILK